MDRRYFELNNNLLEQCILRVMFFDICQRCVRFKDPVLYKKMQQDLYLLYDDFEFDEKTKKKAINIWKRRAPLLNGEKAYTTLLILYHFTLLTETEIEPDSHLQRWFEELSEHIPADYFPKTEKQTDNPKWLDAKGKARKLWGQFKRSSEVFL
jgi:hypothetical protein